MLNKFTYKVESDSLELSLLLELLKDNNKLNIDSNLLQEINWNHFLHLVWRHRVYSYIYFKFKKINHKGIPAYVIQKLHQEYKKNTFQMLNLSGEMEVISKLFIESKIPLLYLKGPVIADDLYGDISLRTSRDLDILIKISDLERAEKILLDYGYERHEEEGLMNERNWRRHHITFFHAKKGICIELHWRLQSRPSKEPSFFALWERKRKSKLTNFPVYFLGNEDLFLFLVSHGARHGWGRLRWLLDIDKISRKSLNTDKVKLLIKEYKNHYMVGQAIILSSQLLNTPVNKEMQIFLKENHSKKLAKKALYFINEIESYEIIMSTNKYRRYLFSLKSAEQKTIFLLILFYPGKADFNTLKLPKSLHFLYFPLRPFLKTWRIARKVVIKRL
ncbi:nucleotidyltransferase family protein [Peribacillus sp. NPDC096448]|uniref:nucleotidyltransferase domain-containing protein n=1 Tax=Peribacillus sp. NPDC096448 TaxID=3364395 RepID=UPI0037F623AD